MTDDLCSDAKDTSKPGAFTQVVEIASIHENKPSARSTG